MAREEVVGSRLGRYYELTDSGATRLADEVARLTGNAQKASRSLAARTRRVSPRTHLLGTTS